MSKIAMNIQIKHRWCHHARRNRKSKWINNLNFCKFNEMIKKIGASSVSVRFIIKVAFHPAQRRDLGLSHKRNVKCDDVLCWCSRYSYRAAPTYGAVKILQFRFKNICRVHSAYIAKKMSLFQSNLCLWSAIDVLVIIFFKSRLQKHIGN